MGIRIEGNLFYIQSKEMSMIIENKEGDLLFRHIGGKIAKYHGSNAILEKDHAFSGNPTPSFWRSWIRRFPTTISKNSTR